MTVLPDEVSAAGTRESARVRRLEAKVDRVDAVLVRLEPKIIELVSSGATASDLSKVQADLAELKGRVTSPPSWWMLLIAMLGTWGAGARIVFTLVKAGHP